MKNVVKFTIAFCLACFFLQAQAQVKIGPKVGLNLAKMTLKASGIAIDPKTLVGFNIGAIAEFPLAENVFLQPGVLFSAKGSKYSIDSYDMKMTPGFIEIPVNCLYKLDLSSAKLLLFAGPYFGFGISGSFESDGESVDISYGSGEDNDMKPFDFGLNIGVGAEIQNIEVSAQYGLGLANLAPVTTNDTQMKVKVIGISVAYLFGAK
jgi:hypothetical protein